MHQYHSATQSAGSGGGSPEPWQLTAAVAVAAAAVVGKKLWNHFEHSFEIPFQKSRIC